MVMLTERSPRDNYNFPSPDIRTGICGELIFPPKKAGWVNRETGIITTIGNISGRLPKTYSDEGIADRIY